ncbi:venom protease-like [Condylostylus longicornis]|uniref:venom protease-like n=1 Tax=Condylostylus longicornis TaxID=2530218 RepID=UPI00244E4596|nr:venom protease-like [Condylostylus longicornis]
MIFCNQEVETCIIKQANAPGICKSIYECPTVFKKLQMGKRDYTVCPNSSQKLLVCCPIELSGRELPAQSEFTSTEKPQKLYERKCLEYLEAVYEKPTSVSLAHNNDNQTTKNERCGFRVVGLVVGGSDAEPREFPHMCLLGYSVNQTIKWECGGSLISEKYVLTAAHCIKTGLGEPKIIRIGDLNINSDTDDAEPEEIPVEENIVHPNYNKKRRKYDIALLKLQRNVDINTYRRPACLPSSYDWPYSKAIVTGWGNTEAINVLGSSILQKVVLEKFTENECNNQQFNVNYEIQNCLGSRNTLIEMDSCQGDSGGPVQIKHPTGICMWEIVGITSFGKSCGAIGIPSVYTRVYPFNDWIENIVWK